VLDVSPDDAAIKLDIGRATLYNWYKELTFDPDRIKEIQKHFPDFLKESKLDKSPDEPIHKGNIIYVPLYAYGGFLGGYRNTVFIDQLEHFRLPGVTGEHYAFEIGGYSMMKPGHELSATPGDIAISRLVEDFKHLWKGKGYILQTVDGLLYKIFDQIKGEKAHFHSLNDEYDGYELPLKEIKRVYFVDFILKKQTNS
jgi:hypothetical protein